MVSSEGRSSLAPTIPLAELFHSSFGHQDEAGRFRGVVVEVSRWSLRSRVFPKPNFPPYTDRLESLSSGQLQRLRQVSTLRLVA